MPPEGCVPVPEGEARLVVTAKPGKTSWALDEVADTIFYVDPEAMVSEAGYEGVIVVKARASITEVVRTIKRFEYAFISFITPILFECTKTTAEDVASVVARLAGVLSKGGESVALRVKLRGKSKEVVDASLIERVLASLGIKFRRRSHRILVIEGIDDYVGVGAGNTRPCGVGCTFVDSSVLTIK